MAVVALSKRQIRQALIRRVFRRDEFILSTPTSATASSIVYNDLTQFPNGHFTNGVIRGYVTSAETKRVASFVGSTGTITPSTTFSGTPTNIEVLRSVGDFELLDESIESAVRQAAKYLLVDSIDLSQMALYYEDEYAIPSNWVWLNKVEVDVQLSGGDRFPTGAEISLTMTEQGLNITSATAKLAQPIVLYQEMPVDSAWCLVRQVGAATGTVTATIQTTSAGLPTGTVVTNGTSNAVTLSAVSTTHGFIKFSFPVPPVLTPYVTYALVLTPSAAVDASNYLAWRYDTVASYQGGQRLTLSGSTWTTQTGCHGFRLVSVRNDWRHFDRSDLSITMGANRLVQIKPSTNVPFAAPLRFTGQATPALLADDATVCDIDADEILIHAIATVMEQRSAGDQRGLPLAQAARADQQQAWQMRRTVAKPKSLRVQSV